MSDSTPGNGGIDTSRAHPARRYNYLLGGKDNFAADRESAEKLLRVNPHITTAARQNRSFLQRVVRVLATEYAITQFLDIGPGLPTANNTHEVAQSVAPASSIVYVDNDPHVMVHARALLTSSPQGKTAYIEADLLDPDRILTDPALRATLDLDQPVALTCIAVLHFLPDDTAVRAALRTLLQALAPGSVLALSHGTLDPLPPKKRAALEKELGNVAAHGTTRARSQADIAALITELDLDLLEPGIVSVVDWRPDVQPEPGGATAEQALCWAAVARRR
uniref:SAM-dependent methyltransferase n=1 Tax=Paractinoplanes polyasparticus TaxID=2856853 RepID=UPI001C8434E4|nr:SAM-dependent methyltransferase [Actinoplanes polyasparticus]